jgi:hypothetical protein
VLKFKIYAKMQNCVKNCIFAQKNMTESQQKHINDIFQIIKRLEIYTAQMHSFQDYAADIYIRRGLEREFAFLREPLGLFTAESNVADLPFTNRVNRLIQSDETLDDTVIFDLVKRYLVGMRVEIGHLLE